MQYSGAKKIAMPAKIDASPDRPLGALKPPNPEKDEPPPKEWVGDIEVVDDEPE